jgi:hypothetical protein
LDYNQGAASHPYGIHPKVDALRESAHQDLPNNAYPHMP